jgi:hypothetical protein
MPGVQTNKFFFPRKSVAPVKVVSGTPEMIDNLPFKDHLKTIELTKTGKTLQIPEDTALPACRSKQTERAGFEPAVRLPVHTLSKGAP